jgi:hypothetical protein
MQAMSEWRVCVLKPISDAAAGISPKELLWVGSHNLGSPP